MSNFATQVKELIPGTKENKALLESQRLALEVMEMWQSGELVYSQLKSRILDNRDFYLGKDSKQYNSMNTEGELRVTANVGATVIDLMVYLLSNNPPSIQAIPIKNDESGQVEASVAEDLANKALKDAGFHKTFRNTCWNLLMSGYALWYPFWNTDKMFGKKKNKFDFSLLNPLTTRVFFQDTDYEKASYFITTKRMRPEVVYEKYNGFEARPDSDNIFLPESIKGEGVSDQMVTVFKRYDSRNIITVIDGRVAKTETHDFDFTPLIMVNNKFVVNDAYGHDEVFRMLPVAQELNMLISAASEIARDLAWPALLEYNNALANKKLPKMRGNKIPVRRTDKGEGLEYMINPAQITPLLSQIQLLLDLFHFVALMPKAAAGIFDSSVTSGFQARIAMQPATLATENKRVDFNEAIVKLVKSALFLIEKHDGKSLEINESIRLRELYDLEFRVAWPDNLPIDIAREIQNLVIGIQNSLTSVTQSIDKYNTMMGMGSTEETKTYLKQESNDPELAPDRAVKIAQVQQVLAQIQQATEQVREKLDVDAVPEDLLPGGNVTNAERALGQRFEEEQKATPDTAREALPPESLGGGTITEGEL